MQEQSKSKILFAEILNGYSKVDYKDNSLFIKHFDNFVVAAASIEYQKAVEYAKSRGVLTQAERLQELISQKLWSPDREKEIDKFNFLINSLKKTKSKEVLPSRKDIIQKEIAKNTLSLNTILEEKAKLIDCTVENFANRKFNEFCVFYTIFKDKEFKNPFFKEDELDDVEEQQLEELITIYRNNQDKLIGTNIKLIACSTFFLNTFILSKDSVYEFYGKFVKDLTYYQIELYHHGSYFKNVLTDSSAVNIPDNVKEDPDLLVEWFENREAGKKISQNSQDADAVSYVGATKEDLKKLGIDNKNNINISKELEKKGGNLSMADIIKLHNG